VAEARAGLVDKLQGAFGTADDAVRGKTDQLFTEPSGSTPHFSFFIPDQRLADDLGWQRYLIEQRLSDWRKRNDTLTSAADLDAAVLSAKTDLDTVKSYLDGVAGALDKVNGSSNPSLAPGTIDGYKAGLSVARSSVLGAQSGLNAGLEKLRGASAALDIAASQKTLKAAAPAVEDVAVQEAVVLQAAASVEAVRVQLGKTALHAPFAGVVTRMDAKVGATAAPGVPLVTVIGDGTYEIEAIVPEADIADVNAGEDVTVTLDAYGTGVPFTATVALVDPAQTAVNGVNGYKVTLRFRDADVRIKPGMTANAAIIAGTRKDALVVPRDAVILRDGHAVVIVTDGNATEQREIKLGLRGDEMVEVTDGLKEGERIANFGN
jgi:RND family efflux transporter MFP subunit